MTICMLRIFAVSVMIIISVLLNAGTGIAAAGDSDRAAVEKAMQTYASLLRSAPAADVAACYGSDGELLLPGMAPLLGPAAIRDFMAPMIKAYDVESVTVATDLLEVNGSSASQWGEYQQVAGERGKPKMHLRGRYSALWHKEKDGRWLLLRMMMQPLPADTP